MGQYLKANNLTPNGISSAHISNYIKIAIVTNEL